MPKILILLAFGKYLCCALVVFSALQSCSGGINPKVAGAKWEKIGPGGGGSTFIPTFSDQTPDKFLVKCDMTGSYLTQNGGSSYDQINFAGGASCYAFDPNDSDVIYIGSSTVNRSNDNGRSWEQIFPLQKQNSIFFRLK